MTRKSRCKRQEANTQPSVTIQSSDEESEYLPLKYPQDNNFHKKIQNFMITSQDIREAGQSKASKESGKSEYKCGKCHLAIKANQTTIECQKLCKKWFHLKCTNLESKDLDFFIKEMKKPNGKRWSCENCDLNTSEALPEHSDWKQLVNAVCEIKLSMEFISNKYEEIRTRNDEILQQLKDMRKERAELKAENEEQKKEIANLKKEIISIKKHINNNEQEKLKNNIELKGVAVQKETKDEDIVKRVLQKLEVKINDHDICHIKRTPTTHTDPDKSIIKIELRNEGIKKSIMEAAKRKNRLNEKLTTKSIDLPGPSRIIYVNEDLTSTNKYLLGKSKELRRYGFKYVWWQNQKVLVRRTDSEKSIVISDESDIQKLYV